MGSWCIPEFMCFTLLRLRALYHFPALLSLFIHDSSSYFFFWFSKFPFSCPVLSSLICSYCVPQVFPLPLWPSCVYMSQSSFVICCDLPYPSCCASRFVCVCVCVSHIISQFNTFFYNPACHKVYHDRPRGYQRPWCLCDWGPKISCTFQPNQHNLDLTAIFTFL